MKRTPHTWGSIFRNSLRRGDDHGYAAYLADQWEARMKKKQMKAHRIWAMHCPFDKYGVPVMGAMGRSIESVIVIKTETWNKLCEDIPQLGTTQFEVGTFTDRDEDL